MDTCTNFNVPWKVCEFNFKSLLFWVAQGVE